MPTINVDRDYLFNQLDKTYTKDEFEEVCFEFGIELEEETSELIMASKEVGESKAKGLSDKPIYRIDIPANRIDLLCPEGLTRALGVYLGVFSLPTYKTIKLPSPIQVIVRPETAQIRPFVVAAVLRNITFTPENYSNFIELQEKLHANICRKRTLVAIGTHDLDTIQAPFTYEALAPEQIKFVPLNQTAEMNGHQLMDFYETDRRLSKFLPIIKSSPVFPVIYDANRKVLSLPPIINSDHSKIKLTTRNVFIECTATDLTKAKTVLNDVVIMFSQYCKDKFSCETVDVILPDGSKTSYPTLESRTVPVAHDYITGRIGVSPEILSLDKIKTLLLKMGLESSISGSNINVRVPPSRSDILHPCDIMEDVAIAYGFNNIPETVPKTHTIAQPQPLNKLSDALRREIAMAGCTEVIPLILCSHDENFGFLRKEDDATAVLLANPKTAEYQVVRTSLIPGILKTLRENRKCALPLKLFEVSDVVFRDESVERKARNQRNVCMVYCGTTSGFEVVHGIVDRILHVLDVKDSEWKVQASDNPTFFPGRCAKVVVGGKVIGEFGILHPQVVSSFEITYPCSALEINIEGFL